MTYYIINLPATRQAQKLTFWGVGYQPNTADYSEALVVNEDHLNANLERFDNGRTTRAILTTVVQNHTGDWRELVGWTTPAQQEGAAA